MRIMKSWTRWAQSLAALLVTGVAAAAQAQSGTIAVHVIEFGGSPIAQSQVAVVGTNIGGVIGYSIGKCSCGTIYIEIGINLKFKITSWARSKHTW